MACIAEATTGFPNANGHIPFECATIAEVLGERGWNTYMLGKWHLVAADEMNMASTKRNWPVGRGFERYYGFLGGETNQWYPDLVYDNHPVEPAGHGPRTGYHLTDGPDRQGDRVHQDAKVIAPDKPFFMYFCPGACHAPHHAPQGVDREVQGQVRHGLRGVPRARLRAPEEDGDLPGGRRADARSTRTPRRRASTASPGTPLDVVRPWDSLSDDEKELFCRMAEVYAGFLSPHRPRDRAPARLPRGDRASSTTRSSCSSPTTAPRGEGGPNGSVNENKFFNGIPDTIEENLKYLDELGSPATYNHYPVGWAWAFNTPFKMWKRYNFEGGVADPLVVSWPKGISAQGELRHQFLHATDIVPTIYDCLGIELPEVVKGYPQIPLEGRELPLHVRERRRADAEGDRLLLDARLAGDLAQGLEGGQRPPDDRRLGPLRRGSLGAVQHRRGSDREPRPRGRAPGRRSRS